MLSAGLGGIIPLFLTGATVQRSAAQQVKQTVTTVLYILTYIPREGNDGTIFFIWRQFGD